MSGRRSKTNGKTKKTENAVETTKDKNEKDVVTTSKETVSVTSTGNSRRQNAERIHCQRMRGKSAQATSPDNPRDMPLAQRGPDTMGSKMDRGAERPQKEMPPLESNPLSEEDAQKLQQEVKALEETLSATVASNEQRLANLVLERDAEKEKVLQIEKDKRAIQEECAKYKQELEELKGQPANIQVPLVACNDKEGTASDDEYKSMETTDTTTNVGAGVPPKSATPSTAEGEERHHQHHEIEFQKSVNKRSNIQISGQTAKLENPVEELQTRLLEVEAEKDAALQEKGRLAKEVASLQQEMMAQAKRMEAAAAKERSGLEGECVRLRRECEELKDTKESLQGMLDGNDVGSRGSFHASSVEDHLADASKPVSQSLEPKQQSSLQHSHSKMSSIRRHASCDATLSISDGDQSSELEGSFCIINPDGRSEDFHQGLTENAQTTASRVTPTDHRVTKLQREVDQLKIDKENLQARDEQLTSEITTLQAALAEAREENDASREREAKLQSQCESSATRFDALQKRTKQLMKEAERDRSEVSVSRKQVQDLQAKCASLQESLTHAVEESEARKQHEQIMVQQMNEKLALEQNHLREIDNEKKAKHELAERCEQLQLQVNAYEEDFKAERRDRESAHDKFADKEKEWMEQLENLTQERDRLTGNIFTLKDQLVAMKRELEAKESATVKALKEDFGAVVAKKDEEIQRLTDSIRGLQPIADKFKVLFAEKRDLQHQFDVVMRTNQEVQQMFRNMQSEKAAAESRVKELSMVVGQVTTENEALTQQNSHLVQQIEGFESMFSGMKSKSEALEQENTQLKEAICLPDLQITPRTSLAPPPPQSMTEGRRSLPSPINQRYHQQPVVHPPPPNRPPPPLHHNQDDYRQQGAAIHPTVEGQIAPYGKPHSEHGLIIMDLPAHHDAMAESDSPPSSKGDEQYGRDPYAHRPLAQHTASGDPHRALQRDPRQPQFPHSGPSVFGSRAHAQPEFEHGPAAVGGDARPIKHPPSASERYQAATQPPMDANQLRLHNSNSSASEASLSLPAPLTNRRRDSEATDPVQSGFEVNRRYIGEDINREIRHEARRYKEGNVAVEPAIADAEEWPFDPNLTCTFCGAMFRRGQIREFRYHIDECTARSMEGRK